MRKGTRDQCIASWRRVKFLRGAAKPTQCLRVVLNAPTFDEFLCMKVVSVAKCLDPLAYEIACERNTTINSDAMLPRIIAFRN